MNNKFISGLLTGVLSSLVLVMLLFTMRYYMTEEKSYSDNNNAITEENKSESVVEQKDEILKKVALLESYINRYYLDEVAAEKLVDGIYKGIFEGLEDPYSVYYTKEEYNQLKETSSGVYCGIGATVSQSTDTGVIMIVKPFVDGPAYEAGILPGDILYKVAGEEVTGVDLTEVVTKMKGEEGTKVKLEVMRENEKEPIAFTVVRRKIEVPSIEYKMLEDKVGYIVISEFDEVTHTQFRAALDDLEGQGIKGLVIDLRDNGGGVLTAVVDMLDRMLPKGMIVYTRDKNEKGQEFKSTDKEQFTKPLAVLINGNSASASEVFAGAIQDYGLGTLVGTKSFGKGIVQTVMPLLDGTAIKLTTSKYYTPKGRNIHKIGIEPDVKVELKEKLKKKVIIPVEEDNQLQKAIEIVKEKMKK